MAKRWPREAFGSTLGTQNDPKANKIQIFCISILHTDFRRPPGPHCGRNRLKIACQKQCLDCAGASGSHVGRFTKKSSEDHIFQGFWRRFGCLIEPLGSLWGHDGPFFRCRVRCRCQHHGNHQNPARTYIKSEGKVYLSDKAYD